MYILLLVYILFATGQCQPPAFPYMPAIGVENNRSILQCWKMQEYSSSQLLGITGSLGLNFTNNIAGMDLNFFPDAQYSPTHNAPYVQ